MNVILCYNIEDGEYADTLCDRLDTFGMTIWIDPNETIDEKEWKQKMLQAVSDGTYVLFLLSSKSSSKNGLLKRKLLIAEDLFGEVSKAKDFILHVRLDNCHVPDNELADIGYVDLFPSYEAGFRGILTFFVGEDREKNGPHSNEEVIDNYLTQNNKESLSSGEIQNAGDPAPLRKLENQRAPSSPSSSQQAPTKTVFKPKSRGFVLPEDSILGRVDRYQLIEKLGSGGYGAVYRARDTIANIDIAIKVLPHLLTNNKDELEDIRRNFSLVSRLRHQNIATLLHLHEVQETDEKADKELGLVPGHYLTVMEYVPGPTLKAFLKQHDRQKVPLKESLEICLGIAKVIDYAHSKKIVHRDIKPSNIMLTPEKEIKVLDFGLAAEIRSSMSRVSQNSTAVTGTFPYMSPEQWQGKRLSGRSDQYALAVVFHELVCGEIPFASIFTTTNDSRLMRETVLKQTPDRLAELSRKQNKILNRALAKSPHERYASCEEFISDLVKCMPNRKALLFRQFLIGLVLVASITALITFAILKISTSHESNLVTPVKTEVEDRIKKLEFLDPGQGIGSKLEEIQALVVAAGNAEKEKDPQRAMDLYHKANDLSNIMERVAEERDKANKVQAALKKIQSKSELDAVPKHAQELWKEADSLSNSGLNHFEIGDFVNAEKKWNEAIEKLRSAEIHAKRVKRILRAKSSYEEKLSKINHKLLDDFGGKKWSQVKELIVDAENLRIKKRVKESARLWEKALKLTSEVINSVVNDQKISEARKLAQESKSEAEKSKIIANSFKAQMYANTYWSEGIALMKTAQKYFEAEELIQAKKKWDLAAAQFKQAETHSENIRRLIRAKSKYKSTLAKIDERILYEAGGDQWEHTMLVVVEAEGFERNGMFNAALSKWDEASDLLSEIIGAMEEVRHDLSFQENFKKARQAKGRRDWEAVMDFSQKALEIKPDSQKANALKQVAEEQMSSKVTVVSIVDKEFIEGATITINDEIHNEETPSVLKMKLGKEYVIKVELPGKDGIQFEPFETTFKATTSESQTIRAVFTRISGPEFNKPWKVVPLGMDFVPVNPGSFRMGTSNGDDDEMPLHLTIISEPFWIGAHEVSQFEYQELMGNNPSNFLAPRNPIENISWHEAVKFCEKLTKLEKRNGNLPFGYVYRLPTEAEWEYCCRAGTDTAFGFGDSLDATMANFNGKYPFGNAKKGEYRKQTVPVDSFAPNSWKIFNMHGNVWEWCLDQCDWDSGVITDTYRDNIRDPINRRGPYRIIRGGNWRSFAGNCRSTNRHVLRPASRNDGVGLRVVLAPDY